jgi:hypothetical protein
MDTRKAYSILRRNTTVAKIYCFGVSISKREIGYAGPFVGFSNQDLNRDMKVGEEAVTLDEPAFVVLAAANVGPIRIMVDEVRGE